MTEITSPPSGSPLFSLGQVVATPSALAALELAAVLPEAFLNRHARGDWGDLGEEDRKLNIQALSSGERLLSAYTLPDGTRIWIITEAGRSATTLLLPDEY